MKCTTALFATSVTLALASGCGAAGGELFDMRLLVVPAPGQMPGQALCATGNSSEEEAQALVDDLNANLADDQALLLALQDAAGVFVNGMTRYEVTVDGRTLQVDAVTVGAASTYTGTINGEQAFSGQRAVVEGQEQGSIVYGTLSVSWVTEADGTVKASRARTDATDASAAASLFLEPNRVRIVAGDRFAGWTAEAGLIGNNTGLSCWGADQCNAECSADLVSELSAQLAP